MENLVGHNDTPLLLSPPYNAIVTGSTQSGKSYFVRQLVEKQEQLHTLPFERIFYCHNMPETELLSLENVKLIPNFPDFIFDESETPVHTLIILDDFMETLIGDKRLISLFTRMRHRLISVIFIVQNLYFCPKVGPCIRRNTDYYFIFENRGDLAMISYLNSKMFPDKKGYLLGAYRKALKRRYGYLLVNLKPDSPPEFKLFEGILPQEQSYVYL